FVFAAAKASGLPEAEGVEVAFAGRSNVGKSSLINALTGQANLARTSHQPGRTQEVIFFANPAAPNLGLVDLPGYGYAAVSKKLKRDWGQLILDYLAGRPNLVRVFLLVDSRRGVGEIDHPAMDLLDKVALSYQIVLTKVDKVKIDELDQIRAKVVKSISKRPAAYPDIIETSSAEGTGTDELRKTILRLAQERGF
ncbi:hypothetical protein CAPTEDRAFT_113940, partial [Capitella teleta]